MAHRQKNAVHGGTSMAGTLDPVADFEPGIVPMTTIEAMRQDARWVENGIFNYDLTTSVPYTFSLLYNDGGVLSIPLTLMFFEPLATGLGTLLFMRRHRSSG